MSFQTCIVDSNRTYVLLTEILISKLSIVMMWRECFGNGCGRWKGCVVVRERAWGECQQAGILSEPSMSNQRPYVRQHHNRLVLHHSLLACSNISMHQLWGIVMHFEFQFALCSLPVELGASDLWFSFRMELRFTSPVLIFLLVST